MLKGNYTAVFVSVVAHVLLLLGLFLSAVKVPKAIKKNKAETTLIKSFLYSAPKKSAPKKVAIDKVVTTKKTTDTSSSAKVHSARKPLKLKKLAKENNLLPTVAAKKFPNEKLSKQTDTSRQVTNAVNNDRNTNKNKVLGTSKSGFSSYDRLSGLRRKLEQQQREHAFEELTQKRSASIMDADQFPVPKSIVPLTREQKYQQNTSKSHVGSITKNDNGTCTIYREQILGSPVEATTSSFACGESKFDKSFREHMKKVQAKLGK